jgi:2,3-bisphosphoglycerate-dependent phosphoglycerate mutase
MTQNLKLVLLRHGESEWNKENRFTGWTDVDLTPRGREEARKAAQLLTEKRFEFNMAFASVLKRSIETLEIVLKEMKLANTPTFYSWRLNERHYGVLQGMNKSDISRQYGEKQMLLWRRSYAVRPPALKKISVNYSRFSLKEQGLTEKDLPLTESLKDVQERLLPYWQGTIVPQLKEGKKIIISAHGNSIRALVKYLDRISDEDIAELNIPYGIPLVYEFDNAINKLRSYYLGNKNDIKERAQEIANQGRLK